MGVVKSGGLLYCLGTLEMGQFHDRRCLMFDQVFSSVFSPSFNHSLAISVEDGAQGTSCKVAADSLVAVNEQFVLRRSLTTSNVKWSDTLKNEIFYMIQTIIALDHT